MIPTVKHLAELSRIAADRYDLLSDVEALRDLMNHEPPLVEISKHILILTEDGQRVVDELVCTLEEQS